MTAKDPGIVQIPAQAVDPTGDNVNVPTADLLRWLNLLPKDGESLGGASTVFGGPPDSVAVLEAGATAASKWWSVAIAGSSTAITGALVGLWESLGESHNWNQPVAIVALGLVLASGTIGITYLLGSDVRGRAAAMTSTIDARRDIATKMIQVSRDSYAASIVGAYTSVPMSGVLDAENSKKHGVAEQDWKAVAARQKGDSLEFLLVKGNEAEWVPAADVKFA